MPVTIVIGKNFGDEGKGLAIDYFASRCQQRGALAVCVRHNGGAQAGHTVDRRDGRFVFSQLSSASFRGVPTYWADSFLPDLYKLPEEAERFAAAGGTVPEICASPACRCTYIGDILVNMLLETRRGENRHGSCGMGINEAVVRSERHPLYLGDVLGKDAEALYRALLRLHREYLPQRLSALGIDLRDAGEYGDLLQSSSVLRNAAEGMARGAERVKPMETAQLRAYDEILFEGAQGLLLDEQYTAFAPHLTSSRTGLHEPSRLLREVFGEALPQTEIVYVTRSYVTRHGAGPLPHEHPDAPLPFVRNDRTNVPNEWQGVLRAAPHGDAAEFAAPVRADLAEGKLSADTSLFVTHLNETGGCLLTESGRIPVPDFCCAEALRGLFCTLYSSDRPLPEGVQRMKMQ